MLAAALAALISAPGCRSGRTAATTESSTTGTHTMQTLELGNSAQVAVVEIDSPVLTVVRDTTRISGRRARTAITRRTGSVRTSERTDSESHSSATHESRAQTHVKAPRLLPSALLLAVAAILLSWIGSRLRR